MNQSINIRVGMKDDAETLAKFNRNMAIETENKDLNENTVNSGVLTMLENPNFGFYLVAEVNKQVVGSLMITTEWSDWRNSQYWWIQSVYVMPMYRKQGIYKSLYEHVKLIASKRMDVHGFRLYVEKNNRIAQETYRKLGMSETEYFMFEENV
ncbi:MAG: GNAT family N-acetyltransferase [Planctomycetes bacterium]|nr:GNAT family N-acetyltransferase [Planctomycetota bacterium]